MQREVGVCGERSDLNSAAVVKTCSNLGAVCSAIRAVRTIHELYTTIDLHKSSIAESRILTEDKCTCYTHTVMSRAPFDLPETQVPKDVIERVQFSLSSRNAGFKVSECLTHVFVSPYADDPAAVSWQYVSSGVTCLLRKKELTKNGRKLVWTVHMCLYNVTYGVLVWKGALGPASSYTAVTDTFHVFVMQELNAIVGLLFDEASQAKDFLRAYLSWDAEKVKEERARGSGGGGSSSPAQFRKEMISKPCNFQHIQGTQALDECMEIEKIKTDIQATFFGLGSPRARRFAEAKGGKRKKDSGRPRIQLQNVSVPHKSGARSGTHVPVESSKSLDMDPGSPGPRVMLQAQESLPGVLRHSMPPQVSLHHHQSQPDLLGDHHRHQADPSSPPGQPMSPQYDSLPREHWTSSEGEAGSSHNHPRHPQQAQRVPSGDSDYDTLEKSGEDVVMSSSSSTPSGVPLQNGSDHVAPNSPVHHGLVRVESPLYDSLQKNSKHNNPLSSSTEVDRHHIPHLYLEKTTDDEVAGYSSLTNDRGGGVNGAADYTPPPRLSPLSFEKEFSNSPFFHPAFVTSTTNC